MSSNPLQIVDISTFNQQTAQELLNAATTQGFLFIEGHGFTHDEVTSLFKMSKEFFELPQDYKQSIPIDNTNHGYTNYGGENLDPSLQKQGDPKEAMNFSGIDFNTGKSIYPIHSWFHQNHHQIIEQTNKKLYQLSIKILQLLAVALNIEDSENQPGSQWFDSRYQPHQKSGTTFRLLHYPGQTSLRPELVIRAGAHTDYGSMTLLFQQPHQEGLEIYSPMVKQWQPVPYVAANTDKFGSQAAAPIVVNIADQLSYWTGGLLRSTIHRVKFPPQVQATGQDRYLIVFFSHPNDDALLEPVPSETVRKIKHRGANEAPNVITARQHLDKRLAGTYGWAY